MIDDFELELGESDWSAGDGEKARTAPDPVDKPSTLEEWQVGVRSGQDLRCPEFMREAQWKRALLDARYISTEILADAMRAGWDPMRFFGWPVIEPPTIWRRSRLGLMFSLEGRVIAGVDGPHIEIDMPKSPRNLRLWNNPDAAWRWRRHRPFWVALRKL